MILSGASLPEALALTNPSTPSSEKGPWGEVLR